MSVAFICPLHSHPYLITALVVNKYEQSAKSGNKGPIKELQTGGVNCISTQTDRRTDREGRRQKNTKEDLQPFSLTSISKDRVEGQGKIRSSLYLDHLNTLG